MTMQLLNLIQGADVEWKTVQEVFMLKNGYTPSKSKPEYWENGDVPWFRMEDIRINGHILSDAIQTCHHRGIKGQLFPAGSIIMATTATIGEHAMITVDYMSNQQFTNFTIKEEYRELLDDKFVFYYFYVLDDIAKNNLNQSSMPSVQMDALKKADFPIPPLSTQQKIVEILDKMTDYVTELTAELTLRQKQYSFYRDKLLTFSEDEPFEVRWTTLGEVGEVTKLAGFEFTKYVEYQDAGKIIALRALNIKGKLDLTDVKYIDNSDFSKLKRSKLFAGDMMFTYVGTVGQVALIDENNKYYLAPNVARIRFDKTQVFPEFMRYYFSSNLIGKQIDRFMQSSSMKNLTMENIRKFELPIPTLKEQEHIISILNKFDALTSDVLIGIPKEIELRRKQYEYWREQLFSFKGGRK
ncbi:restriction endonuclease subunit S [Lactococcus allomyrinae]|uniref:Restriction endonuclease subunit S n=1 Tax=Lactococcus allomyrinae TaxID=2419773 RepID=A0A387BG99_9LACT|nr:restriction endonuclease subunit S [Lactococcus allomyrinae]AYG00027.1 restriction endonuclease subunit S [Lactococcus allomyrinae]